MITTTDNLFQKKEVLLKQLLKETIEHRTFQPVNLLAGDSGILFLLAYYGEYTNNMMYLDKAEELIAGSFQHINEQEAFSDLSFSSGICGLLWAIRSLAHSKHIQIDMEETEGALHPLLYQHMITQVEAGNFDYLHGALGLAGYFLEFKPNNYRQYLEHFNELLINLAQTEGAADELFYFSYVLDKKNTGHKKVKNFSLSHGMASILYYLQNCLRDPYLQSKNTEVCLRKLINFYLRRQNNPLEYNCYYPSWIEEGDYAKTSRLAWCYGDLGIALSFYLCAEVLKDNELKNHSLAIFDHTLQRRDLKAESVNDAALCHGSSGIAKMYNSIHELSKEPRYKEGADYWLQATLDFSIHEDGIAGFKMHETNGWVNKYGLLEGTCGVGLVLLESLTGKQLHWGKLLMC